MTPVVGPGTTIATRPRARPAPFALDRGLRRSRTASFGKILKCLNDAAVSKIFRWLDRERLRIKGRARILI